MNKLNIEARSKLSSRRLLAPLALLLVLSGCDRNNDNSGDLLDDPGNTVIVAPPQSNVNGINVLVLDEEGQSIPSATLLVINDSENGDIVPDDSEILTVEAGVARVPLNSFVESAVVRLEAEQAEYFSNGGRYEVTAGEDLDIEIVLTSENASTEGINIVDTAGDLSAGDISATAMSPSNPEQVLTSVTVPQDLEILDVNGDPLNDSLRMSVVHYDSRDEGALSAFPGGFDVVVENVDEIDTPAIEGTVPTESTDPVGSDVIFQSAGFTAIEIFDSEGNKADKFMGEIDVTMAIPANTLNPETRQPIQVGDIIPVWSFDTDTARWVYEGKEAVQADGRGGLQVTYKADHLSYWNLDFWSNSSCSPTINVDVVSSDGQTVADSPVTVTILGSDANVGYRRSRTLGSGAINLRRVPASFPVSINFRSAVPNLNIQSITRDGVPYSGQSFDICQGATFRVVTDQTLDDIVELSSFDFGVTTVAQCSNSPDSAALPLENISVIYYSPTPRTYLRARTNSLGQARFTGQGAKSGRIYANYNGTWRRLDVSGGSGDVQFSYPTECVITTGASGQ